MLAAAALGGAGITRGREDRIGSSAKLLGADTSLLAIFKTMAN